ncbi:MAG: RNA polymerase sigma factor, partial [Solirubrobacterales bacterium]
MEASALSTAAQKGLLARKSPLLKMKGDEQLVAMVRAGNPGAFDVIVDRYQSRLLGFCRQMLGSTEDAEDVLQEVFVNAYRAMLADNRAINLKPWLYRIARNRSLNHLRRPKAEAQESMDLVPMVEAASTAEKVHNREEFRQLLNDVTKLPETQRAALLLREIDAMSYEEIAEAMETTVPAVKSLLVRARISLAEAEQMVSTALPELRVLL